MLGSDGDDILRGSRGNDRLDGGRGNDVLKGGLGADVLIGGNDADTFAFRSERHSPVDGFDRILDFSQAQGDLIDLSGFRGELTWRGERGFTGSSDELRYEHKKGDTLVLADLDGDKPADFKIRLEGLIDLQKSDFIL